MADAYSRSLLVERYLDIQALSYCFTSSVDMSHLYGNNSPTKMISTFTPETTLSTGNTEKTTEYGELPPRGGGFGDMALTLWPVHRADWRA